MKKLEAIYELKNNGTVNGSDTFMEAYGMAVKALELFEKLNNRPCEACEYHGEHGCCRWNCDFDELLYVEHRG